MRSSLYRPPTHLDGSLNVFATDETDTDVEQTLEEGESSFAWEIRVFLVSAFWILPGLLLGLLLRLVVLDGGPVMYWLAGGGMLGAIAGGMLEADHWTA